MSASAVFLRIDIPVFFRVVALRDKLKILYAVIFPVSIDVVYDFHREWLKIPTKMFLNYKSVLLDIAVSYGSRVFWFIDKFIAVLMKKARTVLISSTFSSFVRLAKGFHSLTSRGVFPSTRSGTILAFIGSDMSRRKIKDCATRLAFDFKFHIDYNNLYIHLWQAQTA